VVLSGLNRPHSHCCDCDAKSNELENEWYAEALRKSKIFPGEAFFSIGFARGGAAADPRLPGLRSSKTKVGPQANKHLATSCRGIAFQFRCLALALALTFDK
jgi:hypothetical protein